MPVASKILWVVHCNDLNSFLHQAVAVGATGVAIRTDNDIAMDLPAAKQAGLKVYGWRWPKTDHTAAMAEAARAVQLINQGMDGYYVNPEGDPGQSWDWDKPGLDSVADAFCRTITAAKPGIVFGVTSHYKGKAVFGHLPWQTFFNHATVLLPQAYWRSSEGNIGVGPGPNYQTAITEWAATGGDTQKIIPMAGELGSITDTEVNEHVSAALAAGRSELHFYASESGVSQKVWAAIKAA